MVHVCLSGEETKSESVVVEVEVAYNVVASGEGVTATVIV